VVFDVYDGGAVSAQVVTRFGVITFGPASKRKYYIPSDRYLVLDKDVVVHSELRALQKNILDSKFFSQQAPNDNLAESTRFESFSDSWWQAAKSAAVKRLPMTM
jgi:hypothetical protein